MDLVRCFPSVKAKSSVQGPISCLIYQGCELFTASSSDTYLQREQAMYFIQAVLSLTCDGSRKAKRMSAVKMLLQLHFVSRRISRWFLRVDGSRALGMIHIWLLGEWRGALPTVCVKPHNNFNHSSYQFILKPKCFVQSTAYRLSSQPLPVLARKRTARTYSNFGSHRNGSDPCCSSPTMHQLFSPQD